MAFHGGSSLIVILNLLQIFGEQYLKSQGQSFVSVLPTTPKPTGQIEQVNQVIEDMLRAYCIREPNKWACYLYFVEFAYNASYHRSIGMSPFQTLYGQECLMPLKWTDLMIQVQASKEMLDEMQQQMDLICLDIKIAQDCQKAYADSKQLDRFFNKRDVVFLRFKKKSSLSLGKYKKLSAQYCGPYNITKKINNQAYEYLLPPLVKEHSIFHISLLKKYVPNANNILKDELSLVTQERTLDITPQAIL